MKLDHYWMPFTDNRRFKAKPRLIEVKQNKSAKQKKGKSHEHANQ